MAKRRRFIIAQGDSLVRYQKTAGRLPAGAVPITDVDEIALLELERDLDRLKFDAGAVIVRTPAELAALDKARLEAGDEQRFDKERELAVLSLILDELNILRAQHGLPQRTPAQARQAYRNKLAR